MGKQFPHGLFILTMTEEFISDREHHVLEAIVRNYILNASPTGSRFLSKQPDFDSSPATIRNIMGDLEDRGFIAQPHTSAGRIPTDKGYRYYVDRMMMSMELPPEVKKQIKDYLVKVEPSDLHLLMEATSKALSRATHQLGIILAPKLNKGVFRHVHIYPIESQRVLLHLTIDSGFVKTMVLELKTELAAERLERACRVINERFFGLTLEDMLTREETAFSNVDSYELGLVRLFVPSIKKLIEAEQADAIYTEGETNIVVQPEFFSRDQVSGIIEILEEKKLLLHFFEKDQVNKSGVIISIGGENTEGQLQSFSVIKTKYQVGHLEGSLGIIGPKRMPYPFLVSAVDYTAKLLGQMYST
jgi:heat-inducible transcriptional repressor